MNDHATVGIASMALWQDFHNNDPLKSQTGQI